MLNRSFDALHNHTPFFLRYDLRLSMARRVLGFATLGALGVILTNLLIFVTYLGVVIDDGTTA